MISLTSPSQEKLTRSPSVLFWFSGGLVITAPPENRLMLICCYRHNPPDGQNLNWPLCKWHPSLLLWRLHQMFWHAVYTVSLFKSIMSVSCLTSFNHTFCWVMVDDHSGALCTVIKQGTRDRSGKIQIFWNRVDGHRRRGSEGQTMGDK